ncbi:hypothetical protein GCM10009636_20050 [Arthrobacter koreensis]
MSYPVLSGAISVTIKAGKTGAGAAAAAPIDVVRKPAVTAAARNTAVTEEREFRPHLPGTGWQWDCGKGGLLGEDRVIPRA